MTENERLIVTYKQLHDMFGGVNAPYSEKFKAYFEKHIEEFLRNQYFENRNMTSWLPERLHDVVYRMDAQLVDTGKEKSSDYFFLWEENGDIMGSVLTDTDTIHIFIKKEASWQRDVSSLSTT